MAEKGQMSTPEDASAITFGRREKGSLPTSDLQIAMPETKPPKPASAEQTGTTSQKQADD